MSDLKEKIANLKINTRSADSKRIEELLEDYELRADEGDYTPNESEKLLMMDFAIGLLDRSSSETENSPPGIEIGKYRLTPMSSRSIRIELIGGGEGGEFSVSDFEKLYQAKFGLRKDGKMTYSSTTLKYFSTNCPKALENHENDVPRDRDIFQGGIAAHAVLQVVGETGATDIDDQKTVADGVVSELITKGRAFNGKPEPPMNPEDAFSGRDIAINYLEANSLPADGKYEIGLGMDKDGKACAYDAQACRYRAITDVVYSDVEGDGEDFQADVICVRDYKSAWPTDADELETLQRKGQAVLTWLHYKNDVSIKGIKLEVVNLRTTCHFSKVIWLDEEGEKLLSQWRDDILQVCNAADTTREARPGGGCLGCAWVLSCEDSYRLALGENVDALALITLEARRAELLKVLKKEITEDAVEVDGGYVGYQAVSKMTLTDNAIYNVLLDFYNRAGEPILDVKDVPNLHPLEVGLLSAAKLGSGNINNIAKHLYDKTEMDARGNLITRCLEDTGTKQFKCWKK